MVIFSDPLSTDEGSAPGAMAPVPGGAVVVHLATGAAVEAEEVKELGRPGVTQNIELQFAMMQHKFELQSIT